MKKNILLLLLLVVSTFAYSQEEAKKEFKSKVLTTDRGMFGRTGATVGRGLQVELGINYEWTDSDNSTYKTDVFSPIKAKLRWALHDRVELNFAISNNQMVLRAWDESFKDKYNYWSPLDIGLRAQFAETHKKVSTDASVYVGLGVYTTMRNAQDKNNVTRPWVLVDRPSYVTPEFAILVAHHFGKRVSLNYNAGVRWTGMVLDDAQTAKDPDYYYTVNVTVHALQMLDVYVEHFNYMRKSYYSNIGMNAGVRVAVIDKLTLDLNGGLGFNSASPDAFAGFGLSYKLGRLK